MSALPSTPQPSWLPSIALGALVSFAGTVLLQLLSGVGGIASIAACCCLMPASFLPFGAVTALSALRRDPHLLPGQGFAVAFIGVGLGMLAWAGVTSTTIDGAEVAAEASQSLVEVARERGEPLTTEQVEDFRATVEAYAPYLPLLAAVATTLLAAFVGMLAVTTLRRRHDKLPLHTGDPTGA